MKKSFSPWVLSLFLLCCTSNTFAQDENKDLTNYSLEDLMKIEVYSVTKKAEPAFRTAAAVYVINPEDIRRSGATSIPELLRMVPGINVQRVNSHSWDVSARGFNGSIFANKLLVLIDGRSVYTPLFGGVLWDVQDVVLEDIERIEVIRGPGGTLWGANAMNGVINIITKKAKDTQGTLVSVGGGSEERGFGTVRYGAKSGDWFYRTYAKYFDRDEGFRADGLANDEWDMSRGGFRGEKDKWTIQGDYYEGSGGQRASLTSFTSPFTSISDKPSEFRGGNLLAKYEEDDWSLQMYWDATQRDFQTLQENRNKFDVEYVRHLQLTEKQEITWGGGYRLEVEDIDNTETVAIQETGEADQLVNLFVQDEIKLNEKLRFTIGNKFEYNIYTQLEVEPNVRLAYDLTDHSLVWAAASRAIRTPSRLDTDGEITGGTNAPTSFTRLEGSHDLVSEKMQAFEFGYRNQITSKFAFATSLYANHYDDIITYDQGATIPDHGFSVVTYPAVNGLEGEVHGIELSSFLQVTNWWKVKGSYAFEKMSLRTDEDIANLGLESLLESAVPQHSTYVRSSFNLPRNFELDATVRYTDSYASGAVPSVTELDINLTKVINDWRISVVGQNLIEAHHKESSAASATQVERGGYLKVTRVF